MPQIAAKQGMSRPMAKSNKVQQNPAKRGRPPKFATQNGTVSIRLPLLQQCHAALTILAAEARTPAIQLLAATALAGLTSRLGPMANPEWNPPAKAQPTRNATAYRLIAADGTEHTLPTSASVAKALGMSAASFRVQLSRGGGTYRRSVGESEITVTRIIPQS